MKKVKKALSFVIVLSLILTLTAVTAMAAAICDHVWTYNDEDLVHHTCTICDFNQRHLSYDCSRCGWVHPYCSPDAGGHLYASTNSDVHDCLRACNYHLIADNRHDGHACATLNDSWPRLNCSKCDYEHEDITLACGTCDPCLSSAQWCELDCCPLCGLCGDCERCNRVDEPDEAPATTQPEETAPPPPPAETDTSDSDSDSGNGEEVIDTSAHAPIPPPPPSSPGGIEVFTIVLAVLTVIIFAAAGYGATVLKKANA